MFFRIASACLLFLGLGQIVTPSASAMDPEIASDRVWAAHFWEWYETGEVTPAAINLKLLVGDVPIDDPLAPSMLLYEQVVQESGDDDYEFGLQDFLDPAAVDIIRTHSLTGLLITAEASNLELGHFVVAAGEGAAVSYDAPTALNVSKIDKKKGGNEVAPVDENGNDVPDIYEEFWDDLNDAIDESQLENLEDDEGNPFYIPDTDADDNVWWNPFDNDPAEAGFDCDDYGEAMENYLENTLGEDYPDMEVEQIIVEWEINGEDVAHIVIQIENDGVIYVNDPQTGATLGPFATQAEADAAIADIINTYYNIDDGSDVETEVYDPSTNPHPYYYDDEDIMDEFEEALEDQGVTDPDDYYPPEE